jgi:hypothetical protein
MRAGEPSPNRRRNPKWRRRTVIIRDRVAAYACRTLPINRNSNAGGAFNFVDEHNAERGLIVPNRAVSCLRLS